LRLLAGRWRSRAELERRLIAAGFGRDAVAQAVADLESAGLIDDRRFAAEVVRAQAAGRLAGDRAIRSALAAKGVDPAIQEEALAGAGEEAERALALATKRAARLTGMDPPAAFRRLYGLLVRRGYGPAQARDACRAALGPVWPAEADTADLADP
jgi:regulatory protein